MEELRGTIREGLEGIYDKPREPAKLLLDDINKLSIDLVIVNSKRSMYRYKSYPESHHIEEEEK